MEDGAGGLCLVSPFSESEGWMAGSHEGIGRFLCEPVSQRECDQFFCTQESGDGCRPQACNRRPPHHCWWEKKKEAEIQRGVWSEPPQAWLDEKSFAGRCLIYTLHETAW